MRLALAISLFAVLLGAPALAQSPDAYGILKRAFDNYRATSSHSTVSMTIHRPTWERNLRFSAWTRGEDDALARFVSPPKDAGNATLRLGRQTWVFNPKLNQVIKLPASMMSQSWMGSDFSYNDLSKSDEMLTDYTHKLLETTQGDGHTIWSIEATPKPGAPVVWGKVTIKVRDDDIVTEQVYFDQDMKAARRMQTDRIGLLGGRPYPIIVTVRPLDMPDQWTRTETVQAQFNIDVPDYLFTLSNLQNPRQ